MSYKNKLSKGFHFSFGHCGTHLTVFIVCILGKLDIFDLEMIDCFLATPLT